MSEEQVVVFQFIGSGESEHVFSQYEIIKFINDDGMIDQSLSIIGFATENEIVEDDENVFIVYEDVNGVQYRQSFYDFLGNEDFTAADGSPLVALEIVANV